MADASSPYILYGSHASYYTAKVRGYLRKKGIPFVERLPSAPRFRAYVRPASGSHRIPQLETPDGTVIQDSVSIVDYLEPRHPSIPAFPPSPRQRLVTHLLELLGSEGPLRLAWQFRWFFPEENYFFVKMEFGRSFRPQGSNEELLKYGDVIADRMLSRGVLKADAATMAAMKAEFIALLELFEAHLQHYPYLLGGHPSAADYAFLGALHAHMGRDPLPLQIMQSHAPRVFRWVEHFLAPEIQSPEFFDVPVAYPPDDDLPPTLIDLLKYLGGKYGPQFEKTALAWAALSRSLMSEPQGHPLSKPGDQPQLGPVTIDYRGEIMDLRCHIHHAWLIQRAQRYYNSLGEADRTHCDPLLAACHLDGLIAAQGSRWIARTDHRLHLE